MKKIFFPFLFTLISSSSHAQTSFTHVASKENNSGNGDCTRLDNRDLDNNPKALLFITQEGKGISPHLIGAFYFKGKWNIMNLDQAAIPAGSTYHVEYFTEPDQDHFQYIIKRDDLQRDGTAFIDDPALNKNPNVQFSSFHSWAPESKEYANRDEIKLAYDPAADKWSISNINKKVMTVGAAYNIGIISGRSSASYKAVEIPELISRPTTMDGPKTLAPNNNAGGDLSGSYPNPTVQKLHGQPISGIAPTTGQSLKWNGSEWTPTSDIIAIGKTPTSLPPNGNAGGDLSGAYPNPTVQKLNGKMLSNTAPTEGQVLKWKSNAWQPADDNVAPATVAAPAIINKPTFLYYTQTTGTEALVDAYKLTSPVSGLDNQFFTLSQSSRVLIHIEAWMISTVSNAFGGGSSEGQLRAEILSNTSNAKVALAWSFVNLFPGFGESVNATGFAILPAGTYYTRVTIGRHLATDPGLRSGSGDKLIIEIFPD